MRDAERYVEHLGEVNEQDLRTLMVELEKEGLIVVVTEPYEAISHLNVQGEPYEEKSNKEAN